MGALLAHAPSTCKVPTANDTPAHFKVALYEAPNPADTIHRSKVVGEPPLPFSALLAIRDAVSAVGGHHAQERESLLRRSIGRDAMHQNDAQTSQPA